jgi:hypothetical protein
MEDYYKKLLIIQYANKEKANAEIKQGAKNFGGDFVINDILETLDLDTAEGAQLDLIGKIVGRDRFAYGFVFGKNYYCYNDYEDPMSDAKGKGMSDEGNVVRYEFKDYSEIARSIYEMKDGIYRTMIRLKILSNTSKATNKEIDDGLFEIFGTNVTIKDNEDMTGTVTCKAGVELDGRLADFLNLFTRPLGVGLEVIYED